MTFVNETLTTQDLFNHGLDEKYYLINQHWTIDHERKLFLTKYWEGHDFGVDTHISVWQFYWGGEILRFTKEIISYKKIEGKHYASTQKITDIQIPEKYKNDKKQILTDIIDAMQVCQEVGVFSKMTRYDLEVDLSEVE